MRIAENAERIPNEEVLSRATNDVTELANGDHTAGITGFGNEPGKRRAKWINTAAKYVEVDGPLAKRIRDLGIVSRAVNSNSQRAAEASAPIRSTNDEVDPVGSALLGATTQSSLKEGESFYPAVQRNLGKINNGSGSGERTADTPKVVRHILSGDLEVGKPQKIATRQAGKNELLSLPRNPGRNGGNV